MSANIVHIALITDGNGVPGAINVIKSALRNSNALTVHVVDMGMSEDQARQLKVSTSEIEFVWISPYWQDWLNNFSVRGLPHVSHAAYAKLLLHRLLPNLDKVIYLDTDTLVLGNLADLFNIDIQMYGLGATWTRTQVEAGKLRLGLSQRYFNSGVMLCNLKMWRAECIEEKFLQWYRSNHFKMKFNDQEVLNGVFDGRNLEIGKRWNVAQAEIFGPKELKLINKSDIAILHFNGAKKYWHSDYESSIVQNFALFFEVKLLLKELGGTKY